LGVSTSGCITVDTSNAVPTAAPALPNFDVPLPLAAVLNGNAVRLGVSQAQINQVWRDTEQQTYANMDNALDVLIPFWDDGSELFAQIRSGTAGQGVDKWLIGLSVLGLTIEALTADQIETTGIIRAIRQGSQRASRFLGQGQRGYFEEVIDTTVEQATQTRRTATQLADEIATRNELALAFANKACDACNDPEVIKRFIGKADNAIRRISDTGLDPDATAQALREAIDGFDSPEAAEAFLDDLGDITPSRATELLDQYACGIGIQSQAGLLRGCSKTLRNNLGVRPKSHEAQHLIPVQLSVSGSRTHPLVSIGQLDTDWDLNGITNGLYLPGTDELSKTLNRPKHRGPHPKYTARVEEALEQAFVDLQVRHPSINWTGTSPQLTNAARQDVEDALNDIAAQFRVALLGMPGGTTVNHIP